MATSRPPEKLINIALDLETVSTERNAGILQIGAVIPRFDRLELPPSFAHTFSVTIRYEDVLDMVSKAHCHLDDGTMQWWQKQDPETRKEVFSGQCSYVDAMRLFCEWIDYVRESSGHEVAIWGNGSDFDNPILTNSLDACGIHGVWKYYNNRDLRTLRALLPIDIKSIPNIKPHTALSDAKHEADIMDRIVETYFQAERTLRYGLP